MNSSPNQNNRPKPEEGSFEYWMEKLLYSDLEELAKEVNDNRANHERFSNQPSWQPTNRAAKSQTDFQKSYFERTEKPETETERVSKRIGVATKERKSNTDDLKNKYSKEKPIIKPGLALLFFGVFLPCMAMLFENNTHFMAKEFFDPFPTFNHYLLFSLIPISNFLTWLSARTKITAVYSLTSLTSGMALGIGILYSLMMLPLTPIFLLMFPIGLLGLAPLISIPFTINAGKTICAIASRHDTFFDPHQFKHLGHLIILVMVISVELPSTLTRMHLADAASGNKAKSVDAVNWLRDWGSKEVLLRACYERSGRATDLIGSLYEHQHPISVEKARNIYYKVTGVAFNSVAIPSSFRSTIQHNGLINDPARLNRGAVDEFDLDPDIAGEMVQGVARGLSVSNSKIKGTVDSNALTSNIDWTFDFTNISTVPREARAKILLPPNAVVTKATMWIDGEEKEAKVMGRAKARATYQRAVKTHKRDPLLVSMQGKDTVLVQCYPVLKGSDTKVRLRIVSPLRLTSKNKAILSLPTFAERNFSFNKAHELLFNANQAFTISNTSLNGEKENTNFLAKGSIPNKLLSRQEANLVIDHNPIYLYALSKSIDGNTTAKPIDFGFSFAKPDRLTVVVDKSVSMKPYLNDVIKGLNTLPEDINVMLIEVGDDKDFMLTKDIGEPTQPLKAYSNLVTSNKKPVKLTEALNLLSKNACKGGRVNSSTIARLMSVNVRTNSKAYGDILWIHGSQPVAGVRAKSTVKRFAKIMRSNIFDLQVASGPNALFDKSSMIRNYVRIPRSKDIAADISLLNTYWGKDLSKKLPAPEEANTAKASKEFNQLVAYRNVLNHYYNNNPYIASAIAVKNHIISPVTSFVVSDDKLVQKYAVKPRSRGMYHRRTSNMTAGLNPIAPLKQMVRGQIYKANRALDSLSVASGPRTLGMAPQSKSYRSRRDLESKMMGAPVDPRYGQSNEVGVLRREKGLRQSLASSKDQAYNPYAVGRDDVNSQRYPQAPSPKRSSGMFGNKILADKQEGFADMVDESTMMAKKAKRKVSSLESTEGKKLPVLKAKEVAQLPEEERATSLSQDRNQPVSGVTNSAFEAFDDDQLELVTESDQIAQSQNMKLNSEAQTFINNGEVVPEPETLPMLLLALIILFGGSLFIKRRKPA